MADEVALQKRAQIAKANRTMFLWIAAASVIVGASIVVVYFMFKILVYGEKVLAAKQDTASTLTANLEVVPQLRDEIRALDANDALQRVKARDSDRALQVILDALPSEANSLALGSSLQNRLLTITGGSTISLESLSVDSVQGLEVGLGEDEAMIDASMEGEDEDALSNSIRFTFTVKGNDKALRTVLENLERSIRTIHVNAVYVSVGGDREQEMTVEGFAFFEPAKKIELREEVVPRD